MAHLAEMLVNALTTVFLGMTPERPLWLGRVVQAAWVVFATLVALAWVYALAMLIRASAWTRSWWRGGHGYRSARQGTAALGWSPAMAYPSKRQSELCSLRHANGRGRSPDPPVRCRP